jgi:histone H3/H4
MAKANKSPAGALEKESTAAAPQEEPPARARKAVSKSERAGLQLTSSRITAHLKARQGRVSGAAGVFLTAAVEELLACVIKCASEHAQGVGATRVGITSLVAATRGEEMRKAFAGYTLCTDRVLPRPGNMLLTSKAIEKKKKVAVRDGAAVAG